MGLAVAISNCLDPSGLFCRLGRAGSWRHEPRLISAYDFVSDAPPLLEPSGGIHYSLFTIHLLIIRCSLLINSLETNTKHPNWLGGIPLIFPKHHECIVQHPDCSFQHPDWCFWVMQWSLQHIGWAAKVMWISRRHLNLFAKHPDYSFEVPDYPFLNMFMGFEVIDLSAKEQSITFQSNRVFAAHMSVSFKTTCKSRSQKSMTFLT